MNLADIHPSVVINNAVLINAVLIHAERQASILALAVASSCALQSCDSDIPYMIMWRETKPGSGFDEPWWVATVAKPTAYKAGMIA